MAGLTMVKGKYKYMPLSEANVKPAMVAAFDGQTIYVLPSSSSSSTSSAAASSTSTSSTAHLAAEPKADARYIMGNYLGGGIAGVVNEAYDKLLQRHVAIKMLNPVGYKLSTPSALRRGEVIKKGAALHLPGGPRPLTRDHVWWVKLPGKRELVACYADARLAAAGVPAMLKELTLDMCVALWGLDAADDDDQRSASSSSSLASGGTTNPTTTSPTHGMTTGPTKTTTTTKTLNAVPTPTMSGVASPVPTGGAYGYGYGYGGEEMKGAPPSSYPPHASSSRDDDDDELMLMLMTSSQDGDNDDECPAAAAARRRDEQIHVGDAVYTIPWLPHKFLQFLWSRKSIYREIAHMHKLTGNSVSGQMDHGGHANVLKLFDVLEYIQPSKSTIFLVLELAAGGELFDRIRGHEATGVDEGVARGYFTQLLSGVLFCHQLGIVHRDLKPENLLLSDADVLKIADFGLSAHFIAAVSSGGAGAASASLSSSASATSSSSSSSASDDLDACVPERDDDDELVPKFMVPAARFRRLNSIVGSPHYVAPEVLQNARYGYDGRKADMWSAGVILYGLLAGALPFGKELQTCPRYLKFCEWIRSLPCDPQSGKLVFDASLYHHYHGSSTMLSTTMATTTGAMRIPVPSSPAAGSSSSTHQEPTLSMTPTEDDLLGAYRLAQVHPNNCHVPPPVPSAPVRVHINHAPPPPTKPFEISASGAVSVLPNGAHSSRCGSRVVSFPTWLFPSKLSPQAVFLMASLLHPEPGKRSSCEEAYRSAWVRGVSS